MIETDGGSACDEHAVVFCEAGAPGASGCIGDESDLTTRYLPQTTPIPLGCKANIVGLAAGTCGLVSSCTCSGGDAGSKPTWECAQ